MNFRSDKHHRPAPFVFLLGILGLLAASSAFAVGTTERERTMSRYTHCEWTDAMSKELYECVKRNNGFNTHWCFDETVQLNCEPDPMPDAAAAKTGAAQAQETAAGTEEVQMIEGESFPEESIEHQEARKRAARQGEENLRGTIEREQTMLKYKDCKWTDEMGRYTYECVKRNNGFGTHWCYDEALQLHCPQPDSEPAS
ncbi:MAG: hypothetical protein PVH25_14360 [Burkholderiales bacterium]|jgi:hypothetical protein